MADGWEEVSTADGRKYYFHKVTRVSRWDKPGTIIIIIIVVITIIIIVITIIIIIITKMKKLWQH